MDLTTIKQMREQRAAIILILKSERYRSTYTEHNLYAHFEISDLTGKKLLPVSYLVESTRFRHTLVNKLAVAGLSFIDNPTVLAGSASGTSPDLSGSEPRQSQRQSCAICHKTNFDASTDCLNPSVFSPCVGDWVCNLQLESAQ